MRFGLPDGGGAGGALAFSIPDGFSFGRGGSPFSRAISSLRVAFSARSRSTSASQLVTRDRRSPIASLSISSGSGSDMDRVNHTPCHVQRTFCAACPGICPGYQGHDDSGHVAVPAELANEASPGP